MEKEFENLCLFKTFIMIHISSLFYYKINGHIIAVDTLNSIHKLQIFKLIHQPFQKITLIYLTNIHF